MQPYAAFRTATTAQCSTCLITLFPVYVPCQYTHDLPTRKKHSDWLKLLEHSGWQKASGLPGRVCLWNELIVNVKDLTKMTTQSNASP